MRLNRLLSRAQVEALLQKGNDQRDPEIGALEYDSRRVVKDSLFFAIEGLVTDGHVHLEQALQKGAVAVVSERGKTNRFLSGLDSGFRHPTFHGLCCQRLQ